MQAPASSITTSNLCRHHVAALPAVTEISASPAPFLKRDVCRRRSRSLLLLHANASKSPWDVGGINLRNIERVVKLRSAITNRSVKELAALLGDELRYYCAFLPFHPLHLSKVIKEENITHAFRPCSYVFWSMNTMRYDLSSWLNLVFVRRKRSRWCTLSCCATAWCWWSNQQKPMDSILASDGSQVSKFPLSMIDQIMQCFKFDPSYCVMSEMLRNSCNFMLQVLQRTNYP